MSCNILIEPKVISDPFDVVLVSAREVGGQHVCGGGSGWRGAKGRLAGNSS